MQLARSRFSLRFSRGPNEASGLAVTPPKWLVTWGIAGRSWSPHHSCAAPERRLDIALSHFPHLGNGDRASAVEPQVTKIPRSRMVVFLPCEGKSHD